MQMSNFMEVINAYRTIFKAAPSESTYNYPDDNPDYDYDDILYDVTKGKEKLIEALLKTCTFAISVGNKGNVVKIFGNIEDRNKYVDEINKSLSGKTICRTISYDEFIKYAQYQEGTLECYYYDPDDGTVDFVL